jgi:hypothetical protein
MNTRVPSEANLAARLWMKCLLAAVILCGGCANEEVIRAREQAAFEAGRAQALAQQQKPTVTVIGNVAHPQIEWTEGLTLARALIAAEWRGRNDPRTIVVRRPNATFNIVTADLFRDQDEGPVLQSGDVIELRQ